VDLADYSIRSQDESEVLLMPVTDATASGPTVAHTAARTPVTIAINEGVGAVDMAMTELQKPIFLSEDFRAGVDSFNQNGPDMAGFEGR
jgi:hypothetical protein